jgi:thiol-disulfide isomerase/thioredoxin
MVFGGLILMAVGGWLYFSKREAGPALPVVGSKLPAFQLADLQGKPVRLSDYAGKTLIINFWATWCPPCRDEMPTLVQYYEEARPGNVELLSVNDGEPAADVAKFVGEFKMNFPILMDADSQYFDKLLLDSLPTTILVGPDGVVRALHIGYMSPQVFQAEIVDKIGR